MYPFGGFIERQIPHDAKALYRIISSHEKFDFRIIYIICGIIVPLLISMTVLVTWKNSTFQLKYKLFRRRNATVTCPLGDK